MRFWIIIGLVAYVLYKIGGFFFRAGAASQTRFQQRRPPEGDINVNPLLKRKMEPLRVVTISTTRKLSNSIWPEVLST
jgi:hypothetical protein